MGQVQILKINVLFAKIWLKIKVLFNFKSFSFVSSCITKFMYFVFLRNFYFVFRFIPFSIPFRFPFRVLVTPLELALCHLQICYFNIYKAVYNLFCVMKFNFNLKPTFFFNCVHTVHRNKQGHLLYCLQSGNAWILIITLRDGIMVSSHADDRIFLYLNIFMTR